MSKTQKWYVRVDSVIEGPFTAQQLKQLAENGKIGISTEVRIGEEGDWVSAIRVKGLLPNRAVAPPDNSAWPESIRRSAAGASSNMDRPTEPNVWPPSMQPTAATSGSGAPSKSALPATQRQRDYARSLGIVFTETATRSELSMLIEATVSKRDDERYKELDELERRESHAWNRFRDEVLAEIDAEDCRLSKATPSQMVQELSEARDLVAILITMPWDGLNDFEKLKGRSVNISFGDDMAFEDVEAVIMQMASEVMARKGMGAVSWESIELLNRQIDGLSCQIEELTKQRDVKK